jgi:Na+/H+ antiporter NhaD/arsenite permease-like protein
MSVFILVVFLAAYAGFALFPNRRSWIAVGAAALLVVCGAVTAQASFFGADGESPLVNWNVMGLFVGMLVLAELFLASKAPAVIAEALLARLSSARAAMVALCALAGLISIGVENVAVVLLLAPIALSLSRKLGQNPAPLLIGISICSNVQGTATMIGDPPSMILAGEMKMGFFDFFLYHGRPGIFFAVEAGALLSLLMLVPLFRGHASFRLDEREKARSWVPSILLALLVGGLCLSSVVDPGFTWFAGTLTMAMAAVGFAWNAFRSRWIPPRAFLRSLDWDTTAFLIGVFVLVGALSGSGWLDALASFLSTHACGSLATAFLVFVLLATVLSGFVDNVPFLLAMIPVVRQVAAQLPAGMAAHGEETLLFGLLVGACMGGNLTPVGASANVTTLGILRKQGVTVRFRDFLRISLPFTAVAVGASALVIWLVWA